MLARGSKQQRPSHLVLVARTIVLPAPFAYQCMEDGSRAARLGGGPSSEGTIDVKNRLARFMPNLGARVEIGEDLDNVE